MWSYRSSEKVVQIKSSFSFIRFIADTEFCGVNWYLHQWKSNWVLSSYQSMKIYLSSGLISELIIIYYSSSVPQTFLPAALQCGQTQLDDIQNKYIQQASRSWKVLFSKSVLIDNLWVFYNSSAQFSLLNGEWSSTYKWHRACVAAFNVTSGSEYFPDGLNKVWDGIYHQSECSSFPLSSMLVVCFFFFYNCLVSSNAHLGGIIQQPHQGRTRNCIGVSTSLSSWVNESHFMLNVQSREKTMQRENMKVVKEKQQLSNSSSVYLSISHSFESYIFFLSLLLPFNSFLMLILKTFSSFIDHLTAIALLISLAINPAHSSKNAHLFHSHRQHTLIRFINALCERVFLSYLPFWPLKERQ